MHKETHRRRATNYSWSGNNYAFTMQSIKWHTPATSAVNIKKTMPIEEWRKLLAMAPDDAISHALDNATQLAISLESESSDMLRRHWKSRFPFFKCPRSNDEFHTNTFYPDVRWAQNHTWAQRLTGIDSGHWEVHPMSKGSHPSRSLQDFVWNTGILLILMRQNDRTQTGGMDCIWASVLYQWHDGRAKIALTEWGRTLH